MPYTITIIDNGIVKVQHRGELAYSEVEEARREGAQLLKDNNTDMLLADIHLAVLPEDMFQLYKFNASHYDVLPFGTLIASVAAREALKNVQLDFCETVALNRQIQFRLFTDNDNAIEWLVTNSSKL